MKISALSRFIVMVLFVGLLPLKSFALDYIILFAASGMSTTIDSVVVQNLTKNTSLKVPEGMLLNLTDNVDVTSFQGIYSDRKSISVYPNPMFENAELMFFAKHSEVVKINVLTIDGRKVSTFSQSVLEGKNVFKLFLPKGTYFVNIVGSDYTYTIKTISLSNSNSQSKITNSYPERQKINQSNTTDLLVRMKYSTNDQLLFKFYSGNYCSVVCDVPTSNKILDTEFVECKDANGKYYSTVKIGSQIWMAENLDYIPEAASDFSVGLEDEQEWMTKSTPYYYVYDRARYGVIYNWYASIAAVPEGWHLPTDSEWTVITSYSIHYTKLYELNVAFLVQIFDLIL